jgi:hypothetical protein
VTESSSDELALKRQQLEQVKRDIENNLEASRLEWSRAIREGHSYREEHTAFMSAYEARCSRLVSCSRKNGRLNGKSAARLAGAFCAYLESRLIDANQARPDRLSI